MKLKAQHVMDATLTISKIIRETRPMPQMGKFYLARMHAKLLPEFNIINAHRDERIKAYDHREMVTLGDGTGEPTGEFSVPLNKMPEFTAAWREFGDTEIEVDVTPIAIRFFDTLNTENGSIEASELITLGELVTE